MILSFHQSAARHSEILLPARHRKSGSQRYQKITFSSSEATVMNLSINLNAMTNNRLQLQSSFRKSFQHGAHKFARCPARLAASRKGWRSAELRRYVLRF
jgi:hypothetical protein